MQEKHLTTNEVTILVDLVKTFGELYQNYPIYGMDNYSVQLTSKELMRLAKVLKLKVEKRIYVTTDDSGTYDQRWFYVDGVKFNSQDEVK
jgi:hypothetical protein